jgi:hypothetical protein
MAIRRRNDASSVVHQFDDDAIIFASRRTAALATSGKLFCLQAAAELAMEEAEKTPQLQKDPIVRTADVRQSGVFQLVERLLSGNELGSSSTRFACCFWSKSYQVSLRV